jgi:glyoxylase-like metal-dependent hydrolase (beta-lactamase superfamily II)
MQVGEIQVHPVHDGTFKVKATDAYRTGQPDAPANGKGEADEDWAPHLGLLDSDGRVEMALGAFLIRSARSADRVTLVDTGLGALKAPVAGTEMIGGLLLDCLASYGVTPAEVTDVVFTHLHFDHVGWATTHGEIVFPNATYRCDQRDWDHFVTNDPAGGGARKLRPITDRLVTWECDGTILPGLDAMVAPGHTPGSTIVVVSDGAARALLLGDVVHCPVELVDDEWAGMGDVDPELAKRTRIALAKELEGKDVPVAAAHFPGMQFGRLLVGEGRRQWVV